MRLPDTVLAPASPPNADYDAMFSMAPKRLAAISRLLVTEKSNSVVMWIREFQWVNDVTFIKVKDIEIKDDGSSDDDIEGQLRIHANVETYPGEVSVEMEERISGRGIQRSFCMMCLHDYIDRTCIDCPEATRVVFYMGANLRTFTFCAVPEGVDRAYYPATPYHRHHEMSEKNEVRNRPMLYLIKADSDDDNAEMGEEREPGDGGDKGGDGNGNGNEDGNGDGNGNGNGNGNDNGNGNGDGNEDGNGDETKVAAAIVLKQSQAEKDEEERRKRQKLN